MATTWPDVAAECVDPGFRSGSEEAAFLTQLFHSFPWSLQANTGISFASTYITIRFTVRRFILRQVSKVVLCTQLIKHYTMEAYGGVDV
jgi:hypothetical protein